MPFFKKICPRVGHVCEKCRTFAAANAERPARRDGRVVDYSSLENCRAARHRGFESLSLRSQKPADFSGLFYFNLTLKSQKSRNFSNTNLTNLTKALVADIQKKPKKPSCLYVGLLALKGKLAITSSLL